MKGKIVGAYKVFPTRLPRSFPPVGVVAEYEKGRSGGDNLLWNPAWTQRDRRRGKCHSGARGKLRRNAVLFFFFFGGGCAERADCAPLLTPNKGGWSDKRREPEPQNAPLFVYFLVPPTPPRKFARVRTFHNVNPQTALGFL